MCAMTTRTPTESTNARYQQIQTEKNTENLEAIVKDIIELLAVKVGVKKKKKKSICLIEG